jgi:hypothetical protein
VRVTLAAEADDGHLAVEELEVAVAMDCRHMDGLLLRGFRP